jgi:predicted ArsR family transcriptional regulator
MTTLQQQARALGDPTRHGIFRYVHDAGHPVDVAELTAHFGLNHNAIRQHLAKLVSAGLVLEAPVISGRRGRPRLSYVIDPASEARWGTSPYERLSVLLAEVIGTGATPVEVGRRAGRRYTSTAPDGNDAIASMAGAMSRLGFEPEVARRGDATEIVLRHCPFVSAVLTDRDTVCELHRGLAEGLVEGTDVVVEELVAKDPRPAGCRLRLRVDP